MFDTPSRTAVLAQLRSWSGRHINSREATPGRGRASGARLSNELRYGMAGIRRHRIETWRRSWQHRQEASAGSNRGRSPTT